MIRPFHLPLANQIPLWPELASNFALPVDLLYIFIVLVSLFFTVAIAGAILYLGIRYRRRSEDDRPEEIHGNNTLEVVWSVIPLAILLAIFFWGADLFFKMERPPSDTMEILVTGKQWMWKIQHPTGQREINNLHIPINQPIKLTMTSEDVIHSFFIPAFRTKKDVLPGRYTQIWFTPTKIGSYHLFCAEYCGAEHSRMVGKVTVLSPAGYEEWLSGGAGAESPVEAGETLFTSLGCITCHSGEKTAQGPAMVGVFGTMQPLANGQEVLADENYVRESILYPKNKMVEGYGGIMPSYNGLVSDSQLTQLIAYIKSIGAESDTVEKEKERAGEEAGEPAEQARGVDEPGRTSGTVVRTDRERGIGG